jgi:Rrf2 family protein
MTINGNTRWALCAMIDLARAAEGEAVNVSTIARRHEIPETALAKVFQRLAWAGLVEGFRGAHGGYRLVRAAHDITVLDVVNAFAPPLPEPGDENALEGFLRMVDAQVRETFATVTISHLAATEESDSLL